MCFVKGRSAAKSPLGQELDTSPRSCADFLRNAEVPVPQLRSLLSGGSPRLTCQEIEALYDILCLSQWPRDLRHQLSFPAQTLGSWVRIPIEAWMSVYVYSFFVLSCV
jgi:hypothetical protein